MKYVLTLAFIAVATLFSVTSTLSKSDDTPTVTISNFAYSPAQLTVTQGQSVTFVNQDDVGHTVTAEDGSFDSKMLDKNKSWTFKFDKAGTYKYYCTVHPSMHGIITVSSP
jgi:plastocyanin